MPEYTVGQRVPLRARPRIACDDLKVGNVIEIKAVHGCGILAFECDGCPIPGPQGNPPRHCQCGADEIEPESTEEGER